MRWPVRGTGAEELKRCLDARDLNGDCNKQTWQTVYEKCYFDADAVCACALASCERVKRRDSVNNTVPRRSRAGGLCYIQCPVRAKVLFHREYLNKAWLIKKCFLIIHCSRKLIEKNHAVWLHHSAQETPPQLYVQAPVLGV